MAKTGLLRIMINFMVKHFIWLYLLLVLSCVAAYAGEFPSNSDLNFESKTNSFPSSLSLEKTYRESSEQWKKFKFNKVGIPQFPMMDNIDSPSGIFDEVIKTTRIKPNNTEDPKLLVFASFSMPEPRLKSLVKDVSRVGGVVLLRGLLMDEKGDPSFKLTADKLKSLQLKKGEGIQIAPNLFEQYAILRIPAFLVFGGGACLKCSNERPKAHETVYGDVSLRYAIKDIEDRNADLSTVIEPMLKRLDVSFYGVDK